MSKIIDCITFFNENFIFDLRYKVLEEVVDQFIICESRYDHKGREKKLNFKKKKYDKKKINYIVLDKKFPKENNPWQNQAYQRDYMLKKLDYLNENDYIFFSDPDEIINPKLLKNFALNRKYGIFMQKCFNYKFNLFNPHESPWQGTRVCMKKNLKSIDFMRQ
jgi:beta-1,4-mannosyl-glycoprotein beta-1,4-N-acetylglucosaminyltransferase